MPGLLFPQGGRFVSEERKASFGLRRRVDSLIRSSGHRRGRTGWAFSNTRFGTPILFDHGSGMSSPGPRRVLSERGMTGVWLTWPAGVSQPRPEGVEPPTVGSEVRCSIQLSYRRKVSCVKGVLPDPALFANPREPGVRMALRDRPFQRGPFERPPCSSGASKAGPAPRRKRDSDPDRHGRAHRPLRPISVGRPRRTGTLERPDGYEMIASKAALVRIGQLVRV